MQHKQRRDMQAVTHRETTTSHSFANTIKTAFSINNKTKPTFFLYPTLYVTLHSIPLNVQEYTGRKKNIKQTRPPIGWILSLPVDGISPAPELLIILFLVLLMSKQTNTPPVQQKCPQKNSNVHFIATLRPQTNQNVYNKRHTPNNFVHINNTKKRLRLSFLPSQRTTFNPIYLLFSVKPYSQNKE